MTSTNSIVAAAVAWAEGVAATVDAEFTGHTYDWSNLSKTKGLPDVAGEVLVYRRSPSPDPRFPLYNLQQIPFLSVWDVALSVMVPLGETDDEERAAALLLRDVMDALVHAQAADVTLGGRVQGTALEVAVEYDPAFVEWSDGVRGREGRMSLTVAEPLEA